MFVSELKDFQENLDSKLSFVKFLRGESKNIWSAGFTVISINNKLIWEVNKYWTFDLKLATINFQPLNLKTFSFDFSF